MCSCCYGSLSLVFTAITLLTSKNNSLFPRVSFKTFFMLAAFLSAVAEGIFFFYSHRADNRFIKGIVGTYEHPMCCSECRRTNEILFQQRVGLAFFLQMGAAFFHFLSFLVAMIATYFSFSGAKDAPDHYSLQRSSRTNVTNIGSDICVHLYRSMEFDAPLMYQSQTPQPNIRPPYSKHEEYERHVAESMPELGMTRLGTPNKLSS
ncbi:hypothetical protein ANCDUO_12074 [Ancylostoma duodenale]|uniref:Uncharacterized protein n=1 Tax=Ancylostoma duodenale TaxID=51022 RepID=A0A0C2D6I6_9BILA|nr:hypothetical protein ANCDUO_12074 [Ancylostoma duodenale]